MSRVPRIRFKGFEEDWEQRKLGEVFKYEQPQAYIVENTEYDDKNDIPILTAGQSFILGYTNEHFGIKGASEKNPVIIFDDFTTSSHYVDFPFKVKSSAMKLLTLNSQKDNIHCAYNILKNINYLPVSHERHWISTFAKFDILLPKCADEQKQVGQYFSQLDTIITLHQRKLEKLKIIKKSMLENLFPQNGEKTPKIRFSGFTEDWEQRKLGEVVGIYDGVHQTPKYQDNGIMFLSVENIETLQSSKYISEDDFKRDYKVYPQENDILMTRIGDVGTTNVIADNALKAYYVSLALLKYKSTNPYFLSNAIQSDYVKKGLANRTLKTAIPMKINKDEIGKVDVMLPTSVKEQTKIGEYFRNIDHLITLHQSKLEKLQKIKNSMLESMFV